jgi:hypothetical protein
MTEESGQCTSGIARFLCRLFGHKWTYLKGAIPEDRKTFRCDRCQERGFRPAMVGENEVPQRYVDTETDRDGGGRR